MIEISLLPFQSNVSYITLDEQNQAQRLKKQIKCSMDILTIICGSNVICSGSLDNTIRFWDIRTNKNELHMIQGDEKEYYEVICLKFIELKKKEKTKNKIKVILNSFDLIERNVKQIMLKACAKMFEKVTIIFFFTNKVKCFSFALVVKKFDSKHKSSLVNKKRRLMLLIPSLIGLFIK
ncbi:hypothetical protein RFI_26531 [Reticulomyxa filosa]|uniref:WD-40 repeat protein n=1 Tax=Reticulomyxa filosa TaxID=46433 RepID=X6MB28_RETFI|nr:hypothetical protein RFI_26531 [Reticulomyxa filosa]|eukprot:ETO10846.1 hypothetical protein RFI_26531 [Reticulomyxa filosa]